MPSVPIHNISGLNLRTSAFLQGDGQILRALNVERDSIGAWRKRAGYITYLGTPDNNQLNSLFSWTRNDGTSFYTYRASGSILYHSVQGTGAWTVSGNGTITNNGHFGHTVLDGVLIGGDGTTASRHSTSGTNFSDTSGAPLAEHWEEFQGRVWAARGTAVTGTNTDMFYSATGTATNWVTDSSSIRIPGPGRVNSLFKVSDLLHATKDSGLVFQNDGFRLIDLATNLGPSSPYSIGNVEGYRIWLNRVGVFGHGGARPELLSNSIQRQIYNDSGSAIAGTTFSNAPGITYKYDWFCSVGTITEDLTNYTIPDAILKYDFQMDEFVNWRFANRPTAFGTYQDASGDQQLLFGDSGGQCYQFSGTATTDNGASIEAVLMGFIHGGTFDDKKWVRITPMTNPGCEAKIQIALSDTFTYNKLKWIDLGDLHDGVREFRFPVGSRGRFLFWKLYESSRDSRFQFYGFDIDVEIIKH